MAKRTDRKTTSERLTLGSGAKITVTYDETAADPTTANKGEPDSLPIPGTITIEAGTIYRNRC